MKTLASAGLAAGLLALVAGLYSTRAAAEADTPPPPRAGDADRAALEARVKEMEKRLQLLEQAMVEKDARIAELQRRLNEQPAPAPVQPLAPGVPGVPGFPGLPIQPGLPGLTLQLNPEEMAQLQKQMEEYMRRNFDAPFFEEDPPGGQDEFNHRWQQLLPQPGPQAAPAQKPRLGVMLQDASLELSQRYRNEVAKGAFVTQVVPGGPAEKAGFMPGDCVTAFDNRPIASAQEMTEAIRRAPAGKHEAVVKRRGEDLALQVTLEAPPAEAAPAPRAEGNWIRGGDRAGRAGRKEVVEVQATALESTPQLAEALKLDEKQRARMEAVLAAHAKGLSVEYGVRVAAGGAGRGQLGDRDLSELVEKHATQAEQELKDTLSEGQIKAWREYRGRRQGISVSRRLEERVQPEPLEDNLNF